MSGPKAQDAKKCIGAQAADFYSVLLNSTISQHGQHDRGQGQHDDQAYHINCGVTVSMIELQTTSPFSRGRRDPGSLL